MTKFSNTVNARRGRAEQTPRSADAGAGAIDRAIAGYLQHLEVERRVSPNTLEAYQRDLVRVSALRRRTRPDAVVDHARRP